MNEGDLGILVDNGTIVTVAELLMTRKRGGKRTVVDMLGVSLFKATRIYEASHKIEIIAIRILSRSKSKICRRNRARLQFCMQKEYYQPNLSSDYLLTSKMPHIFVFSTHSTTIIEVG